VTALKPEHLTAVILAGGLGTRVQHLLPDLPKPMAPVLGRPWLEWVARYLLQEGVRQAVISTGYRAEVVAAHFDSNRIPGMTVQCVAEPELLGTGGGLAFAARSSGQQSPGWVVLNGDTMVFADLALGTSLLQDLRLSGVIFGRSVPDTLRYGSLVTNDSGNLLRYAEKQPGAGVVSTGVCIFRDEALRRFPARTPLSLEREAFPELTSSGALFKVIPMATPFLDIGTPETLPQAASFVQANLGRFALD
jgi:D-glycero-alpha-D-manno-heptose 1-phosphate guanylyltransferase